MHLQCSIVSIEVQFQMLFYRIQPRTQILAGSSHDFILFMPSSVIQKTNFSFITQFNDKFALFHQTSLRGI